MKFVGILIGLLVLAGSSYAQMLSAAYTSQIKRAETSYKAKNYKASAHSYSQAFKAGHGVWIMEDRLGAARAWTLADVADSAFAQLHMLAEVHYSEATTLEKDPDLGKLHKDKRWKPLLEQVRKNLADKEAKLNKPLMQELDSILKNDQDVRLRMDASEKKYGKESKEVNVLWADMSKRDSVDLIQVKRIIDAYGWLGPDVVGEEGNMTLFLVIQHSDLKTQEHYLPLMREAVQAGKAARNALALLEDRVLLGQGKKQIYGSQIISDPITGKYTVAPLQDSIHVNDLRRAVGLEPLEAYAKAFGVVWKPPAKPKPLPGRKIPFTGMNTDCSSAIEIRDSIVGPLYVGSGAGSKVEFSSKGNVYKESNSAWFKFTITKDTILTFDVVNDSEECDMDFVLFRCTSPECIGEILSGKKKPDRVSFSAGWGKWSAIGLSAYTIDTASITASYLGGLKVKKGDVMYLMVNRDDDKVVHRPIRDRKDAFTIYFYGLAPEEWKTKIKERIKRERFVPGNVGFENGTAVLSHASFATLNELVEQMKGSSTMRIEVRGHADQTGTEEKNIQLSEERARAAADYLVSKEIDIRRITCKAQGSSKPLDTNDTEAGRKKNRRVEFVVLTR
jgi:outer membrane protein OmpA-like peptidoglycan-associated protein